MSMIGEPRKVLKRLHHPLEDMLVCARSTRHLVGHLAVGGCESVLVCSNTFI